MDDQEYRKRYNELQREIDAKIEVIRFEGNQKIKALTQEYEEHRCSTLNSQNLTKSR